jgi:hypothetical protein
MLVKLSMRRGLSTYLALAMLATAILILASLEPGAEGLSYSGASPLNTRWDGASKLVELLSGLGKVIVVRDWRGIDPASLRGCITMFFISPEKSFTYSDLNKIRSIFSRGSVAIVVLDEGVYGNQVLEAVGAPVRIQPYKYIGTGIVYGYANISLRRLYIAFAYASPIVVLDPGMCRPIAFVENITVGAECSIGGSKVIVFGDGSIATNAALETLSPLNPYVQLIEELINRACPVNQRTFLVDAKHYEIRLMTLKELVDTYGAQKAVSLYLNPVRYLHYIMYTAPESLSNMLLPVIVLITTATIVYYTKTRYAVEEIPTGIYEELPAPKITDRLRKACLEDPMCRTRVRCVMRRRFSEKCLKEVLSFAEESKDFRRKLLHYL